MYVCMYVLTYVPCMYVMSVKQLEGMYVVCVRMYVMYVKLQCMSCMYVMYACHALYVVQVYTWCVCMSCMNECIRVMYVAVVHTYLGSSRLKTSVLTKSSAPFSAWHRAILF